MAGAKLLPDHRVVPRQTRPSEHPEILVPCDREIFKNRERRRKKNFDQNNLGPRAIRRHHEELLRQLRDLECAETSLGRRTS